MNESEILSKGYNEVYSEILESIQDAIKNRMIEENLSLSEMAAVIGTSASRLSWLLRLHQPYGWSLGWLVDIAYHLKLRVVVSRHSYRGHYVQ